MGACIIALSLGGCPKGAYHDLVVIEHSADSVVRSLQKAEMDAFAAQEITPAEHALIESKIESVGKAGQVLTAALQAGAAAPTVSADIAILVQAVADLNSAVGPIKNPTAKAALEAAVQAVEAVLQNLQTTLAVKS